MDTQNGDARLRGHQNAEVEQIRDHAYRLAYGLDLRLGAFSKEELNELNLGGTDMLVLISMLFPASGGASVLWDARDGRNPEGKAELAEVVRAWAMMGQALSNRIQTEGPESDALALVTQLPLRLLLDEGELNAVGEALQREMGIDPDDPMGGL